MERSATVEQLTPSRPFKDVGNTARYIHDGLRSELRRAKKTPPTATGQSYTRHGAVVTGPSSFMADTHPRVTMSGYAAPVGHSILVRSRNGVALTSPHRKSRSNPPPTGIE